MHCPVCFGALEAILDVTATHLLCPYCGDELTLQDLVEWPELLPMLQDAPRPSYQDAATSSMPLLLYV